MRCGDCCKLYSVVLNFHEWLGIVKSFGVEHTNSGLDRLFLRRRGDGSCVFLGSDWSVNSCWLQCMKPRACQLWPFKVLGRPEFGYGEAARFSFGENELFVYADPMCRGLRFGSPSLEFAGRTVREFVEIALGLRTQQVKTTSNVGFYGFGRF